MPKSATQADKQQLRQERHDGAAQRRQDEKKARDASLKPSTATAAASGHTTPKAVQIAVPPPPPVLEARLPGVNTVVARLLKLNPKLCVAAEAVESKADTEAAGPSSVGSVASASFAIVDARHAQITFVDGARRQRVAVTVPDALLSPPDRLRDIVQQAVQSNPAGTAATARRQEHKQVDSYEADRLDKERQRKDGMQRTHQVEEDAQRAARKSEAEAKQARKAQIAGGLSRDESALHGERNLKIVSGEERGKHAKM